MIRSMLYLTFLYLIPMQVFSQSVDGKQVEEILINSIFEELIKETKDLKPPKGLKKKKKSVNKMSRGKMMIEEMKRRNREKLAKMRGVNPNEVKSGKDIVKAQKKQNKEIISKINEKIKSLDDWQNLAKSEIDRLRKQVISDWKKKHALKIKAWEKESLEFKKNRKKYGDTTFKLPTVLPEKDIKEEPAKVELVKEYVLVPGTLSIPVRNQLFRPTCGSFAGVRLIESELFKKGKKWDLSEQYFYWASKDNCQYKKCSEKGSWVGYGFEHSKNSSKPDIPFEYDCKYAATSKPGNETQIPLGNSCKTGKVKVSSIEYFHSTNAVISHIEKGHAVVASMKLTPNFYGSNPLTLFKNRMVGKKMDSHAAGHSMAIVGYVKLPELLDEGRVCFIVANSWGAGWGKGGYSCISERWMQEQKQVNPFVAVTGVRY